MASFFPASFENLIDGFASLPGIGRKSAQRLAFHILSLPAEEAEKFAQTVLEAKRSVHTCPVCQNLTDEEQCSICSSPKRDHSTICVVAQPRDVLSFERSREYQGVYHVLGGAISPMMGIGPDDIRLKELVMRLSKEDIKEVIIATNSSLEGETTAMYLGKLIKPTGIRVTRIASGVPVGGDLEYIDEVTLLRALEGRTEL
jgi:recombination protein RecR